MARDGTRDAAAGPVAPDDARVEAVSTANAGDGEPRSAPAAPLHGAPLPHAGPRATGIAAWAPSSPQAAPTQTYTLAIRAEPASTNASGRGAGTAQAAPSPPSAAQRARARPARTEGPPRRGDAAPRVDDDRRQVRDDRPRVDDDDPRVDDDRPRVADAPAARSRRATEAAATGRTAGGRAADDDISHPPFEFPAHAPEVRLDSTRWDIPPVPSGPALTGAESLTAERVIRSRRARPHSGWRKTAYTLTRGMVNLGPSAADRERMRLESLARKHLTSCHRIAVISLKGGVGKTTTTAALGSMLAQLRGDRVIAVDANPDRGTLGERVPRDSGATVRHLLEARDQIERYADVRKFTSQAPSRLEVLASDSDPGASLAFSEQDYRDTVTTLERFYNLLLTDCGTGLLHSAMAGILRLANSLIVVSSASLDGARSASATLDWLEAHGFDDLARDAVVVISSVRPRSGMVDVGLLRDHFAARCREVVTIPWDPHLEAGGVLDLTELKPATRATYLKLAAVVVSGVTAPTLA